MATVITEKHSRAQVLNFLIMGVLSLILIGLFIMETENLQKFVQTELAANKEALGDNVWTGLERKTKQRHQAWVYDSGLFDRMKDMFVPKSNPDVVEQVFENKWMYQWINNFQIVAYQGIHRLTIMEHWMISLSPLLICLIITGVLRWKIKTYSIAMVQVGMLRLYLKAIWFFTATLLAYLTLPNILGSHHVWVPPVLLSVLVWLISLIVANYQRS